MENCTHHETCDSNICPRDPEKHLRTWLPGESVCHQREFKEDGYLRRQWKINRERPLSLEGKALSFQYLVDTAPPKRVMTQEQKDQAVARLKQHRFQGRTAVS
jgi:hypothetical protein